MKLKTLLSLAALGLVGGWFSPVFADETEAEKAQTAAEEKATKARQDARRKKMKARKDAGKGSVAEDIQDTAKNVGDELEQGARKARRKVD